MILNGVITKDQLYKANDREIEILMERFNSSDFQNTIHRMIEQKITKNKL